MSRVCQHCGAALAARARFCRSCGSDARTGWSEEGEFSGLEVSTELEDDEYDAFLEREFPERHGKHSRSLGSLIDLKKLVLLLSLAAFLLWVVLR